eukprot:6486350-Amphidinium_carterae.1
MEVVLTELRAPMNHVAFQPISADHVAVHGCFLGAESAKGVETRMGAVLYCGCAFVENSGTFMHLANHTQVLKTQIVMAEMTAVLVATHYWQREFRNQYIRLFVDNES